jgi:hypothetical protein
MHVEGWPRWGEISSMQPWNFDFSLEASWFIHTIRSKHRLKRRICSFPDSQSTAGREHKSLKFENRSVESETQRNLKTPNRARRIKHTAPYRTYNSIRRERLWIDGLPITRGESATSTSSTWSFRGLFHECVKRWVKGKLKGGVDLNHLERDLSLIITDTIENRTRKRDPSVAAWTAERKICSQKRFRSRRKFSQWKYQVICD